MRKERLQIDRISDFAYNYISTNCFSESKPMDEDKIKCFLTLAETLSFTKTAAILHKSQSVISRQILFVRLIPCGLPSRPSAASR